MREDGVAPPEPQGNWVTASSATIYGILSHINLVAALGIGPSWPGYEPSFVPDYTAILAESQGLEPWGPYDPTVFKTVRLPIITALHFGHPEETRTPKYQCERLMTLTISSTGRFYWRRHRDSNADISYPMVTLAGWWDTITPCLQVF